MVTLGETFFFPGPPPGSIWESLAVEECGYFYSSNSLIWEGIHISFLSSLKIY